jgi:predicted DCC family thiol-disulfide oxidoreductase YuxK
MSRGPGACSKAGRFGAPEFLMSSCYYELMSVLSVYFDGHCRVCSHEIAYYQRRDREARVRWVDIMDPHFSAEAEGLDEARIHRELHARLANGRLAVGVDAFIEIWKVVPGFGPLARLAGLKLARPLLDAGYLAFTRIRPYLPRKAGGVACEDGTCSAKGPAGSPSST